MRGLSIARPNRLKACCDAHCNAPQSFEASPAHSSPVRSISLNLPNHFATFASSGQNVIPVVDNETYQHMQIGKWKIAQVKHNQTCTPSITSGLPHKSLCAATAVGPKQALTSLSIMENGQSTKHQHKQNAHRQAVRKSPLTFLLTIFSRLRNNRLHIS